VSGKHFLEESFDWKLALAEEAEDRAFPSHVLVNYSNEDDSGERLKNRGVLDCLGASPCKEQRI
jgi:hypothetical protein